MHITMVKKIRADGSPCRKCADVERRLQADGYTDRVDRVVIADERDPDSEGMRLAREHNVEAAPFFIVEDGGAVRVYTVYLRLVREVLKGETDAAEEAAELLERNRDLDFL
jgi:hypothetical protein